MVHDRSVGTDAQAGGAGIDELDPLDLRAHRPLHEGRCAAECHGAGLKENVIAVFDQSFLGSDVGLDGLLLLGGVLEMDRVVLDGPPLLRRGRRGAIGLGEQGPERCLGERWREEGHCSCIMNSVHNAKANKLLKGSPFIYWEFNLFIARVEKLLEYQHLKKKSVDQSSCDQH